ncbi:hypothetical protein BISA_1844 [Bifidobacterium saguini DSM 23967]|uniref:Uncharacterized protein n=2 Tax=Bifidobacterium saguini TaxID=762210 RepID=A0A087D6U6_9BIFI|nr:hypothetical protein BISA_1844 [Bifidobacterium saguini DSM 23967]
MDDGGRAGTGSLWHIVSWLSARTPQGLKGSVVVLLAVSGVCVLLGVGMLAANHNASDVHARAYTSCRSAVESYESEAGRFRRTVDRVMAGIDMDALESSAPVQAERLRTLSVDPDSPASCDDGMGTAELDETARKTAEELKTLKSRSGRLETLASTVKRSAQADTKAAARRRLESALTQAEETLENTEDEELRVPYLRRRLTDLTGQARTMLDDDDARADDMDRLAASLSTIEESLLTGIR